MNAPPKISVVIPAYNHQRYIRQAIDSIYAQNWPGIELRILDDGSSDDTVAVAEEALQGLEGISAFLDTQANCGSATTLNRLIDAVDADYVAILNSDDYYCPGRFTALIEASTNSRLFFGFSGVRFHQSAKVPDFALYEDWYRSKFAASCAMPTCGFAIVSANITISSSNFLFSRELFDLAGGFEPSLTLTQDWQFAIKCMRWVEPSLVPERLLSYRVHGDNTYRKLHDLRIEQSTRAFDAFVDWAGKPVPNPLAPTPAIWPRYFQYFASCFTPAFSSKPIAEFLPDELLRLTDLRRGGGSDEAAVAALVSHFRELQDRPLQDVEVYLARAAAMWDRVAAAGLAGRHAVP